MRYEAKPCNFQNCSLQLAGSSLAALGLLPLACMTTPDYNLASPPTLLAAGTLQGSPVNLDPTSIVAPSRGQGVFVGSVTVPWSCDVLHGGESGKVAIKSVEDGKVRLPRNVRREVRLLAGLQHDNVSCLAVCQICIAYLITIVPTDPTTSQRLPNSADLFGADRHIHHFHSLLPSPSSYTTVHTVLHTFDCALAFTLCPHRPLSRPSAHLGGRPSALTRASRRSPRYRTE